MRPGGVVILTPDATTEIFRPKTDHGGHDGDDGRSLRYLEWTHAPEPAGGSTYVVDYAIVARGPGDELRVVHDRHTLGLFPEATWKRLLDEAGLELVDTTVPNPLRARASGLRRTPTVRLTTSERISTLPVEHTFVPQPTSTRESLMLTTRQQEIWQFLAEYVDAHGYPPTVREIGDAVGLASPSTVHAHLANLERAGLLRRDPTKPRAIELVGRRREAEPGRAAPTLPLLGRIAAGGPLLAEQEIEDEIAVPGPLGRDADFLLRVTGDSMIEAGILDGDIVVVRKQADARTGEIVVALVGDDATADEATVKTFHRERDGRIRLQPENAALEPLFPEHVEILGRVTGVFRSLG